MNWTSFQLTMFKPRFSRLAVAVILVLAVPFLIGGPIGCSIGGGCDYRCKCQRKCGGAGPCYDRCLGER